MLRDSINQLAHWIWDIIRFLQRVTLEKIVPRFEKLSVHFLWTCTGLLLCHHKFVILVAEQVDITVEVNTLVGHFSNSSYLRLENYWQIGVKSSWVSAWDVFFPSLDQATFLT